MSSLQPVRHVKTPSPARSLQSFLGACDVWSVCNTPGRRLNPGGDFSTANPPSVPGPDDIIACQPQLDSRISGGSYCQYRNGRDGKQPTTTVGGIDNGIRFRRVISCQRRHACPFHVLETAIHHATPSYLLRQVFLLRTEIPRGRPG